MSAICLPKLAKYIMGGLTGALAMGHSYTRFGGFGVFNEIDINDKVTAPYWGQSDTTCKYQITKLERHVLYDKLDYALEIHNSDGVTRSNHVIYSCKPIHLSRD